MAQQVKVLAAQACWAELGSPEPTLKPDTVIQVSVVPASLWELETGEFLEAREQAVLWVREETLSLIQCEKARTEPWDRLWLPHVICAPLSIHMNMCAHTQRDKHIHTHKQAHTQECLSKTDNFPPSRLNTLKIRVAKNFYDLCRH